LLINPAAKIKAEMSGEVTLSLRAEPHPSSSVSITRPGGSEFAEGSSRSWRKAITSKLQGSTVPKNPH